MSKDYAKKFSQPYQNQKKPKPHRFRQAIIIVGILLVAFIGFRAVQFHHLHAGLKETNTTVSKPLAAKEIAPVSSSEQTVEAEPKIHFEFYTALPKKQWTNSVQTASTAVVPKTVVTAPSPSNTTAPSDPQLPHYVVQIGVFSNAQSAGIAKDQMQPLEVPVQVVKDSTNSKTIYRVQAGPFNNLQEATELQAKLAQSKIFSLVKKV